MPGGRSPPRGSLTLVALYDEELAGVAQILSDIEI